MKNCPCGDRHFTFIIWSGLCLLCYLLRAIILVCNSRPAFDSSNWLPCLLLLLSITKLISLNRLAIFKWCRHDLAESSPVSFIIIVFLIMFLCRPLLITSKYQLLPLIHNNEYQLPTPTMYFTFLNKLREGSNSNLWTFLVPFENQSQYLRQNYQHFILLLSQNAMMTLKI